MSLYDRLIAKRPAIFLTPEAFFAACVDYFKWAEKHPLLEAKSFMYRGAIVKAQEPKVRAFTKKQLATYLRIPEGRLDSYKKRGDEWAEVMEMVEQIIYTQKFENAAAGLLNASIIGRDLGLTEKQELSAPGGGPPITFNIQPIAHGTFVPAEPEAGALGENPALNDEPFADIVVPPLE